MSDFATEIEPLMSRRQYLVLRTMELTGCDVFLAQEAVASTAIEHPEWDLTRRATWDQFEKERTGG